MSRSRCGGPPWPSLGACVTGTGALAARTGSLLFVWGAVVLYVLLVAARLVVVRHALRHGLGRLRAPVGR
ncbi:hypothetical protein [Streptomyces collinus]|uniref:hypothetical protein n=1 Tax=Streptomyces collinus TaxID=42684 RepID=UPI0036EFDCD2